MFKKKNCIVHRVNIDFSQCHKYEIINGKVVINSVLCGKD